MGTKLKLLHCVHRSMPGLHDDSSLHEAAAREYTGSLQRRLGQDLPTHLSLPAHDGPLLQNHGRISGTYNCYCKAMIIVFYESQIFLSGTLRVKKFYIACDKI